MPVRALLFDLDDTLLETHHSHRAAMAASCRQAARAHPGWSPERFAAAFTRAYSDLEARLEAGSVHFESPMSFRTRTWEETLAACGLSTELGEELALVYLDERRRHYRLYDEVPAALDGLADRLALVMVTNGIGDLQREKIRAVRLERWFSRILISGEVGSWKPDGAIFRRALELAGVEAREAVMVGDSLARDIRGAQALGIGTVWVRRYAHMLPDAEIRPDAELPDIGALAETIAGW